MKNAPSKLSVRNITRNQNTGTWREQEQENKNKAKELVELAKTLPHLINKPIRYDLKR